MQKAQHHRDYKPLPAFLRKMRNAVKKPDGSEFTQRDLGEEVDEPQSWVHNCESNNRRMDIAEFIRWCEACGVDPADGFKRYLKLIRR